MTYLLEATGWLGALCVLAAYMLISARRIASDSYAYHGLNIAGSFMLIIYTLWKTAIASMLLNVIWMAVGTGAIFAIYRTRRAARK